MREAVKMTTARSVIRLLRATADSHQTNCLTPSFASALSVSRAA